MQDEAIARDPLPIPSARDLLDAMSSFPLSRPVRILVTGFGPFPGAPENPSGALARALAAHPQDEAAITAEILPTTWANVSAFPAAVAAQDPDIVLMLGLAARRRQICVETLAVNEARDLADVEGMRPARIALDHDGPEAAGCVADARALVRAVREAGVPARISRDAGRYICNAISYAVYRHAADPARPRLAVFVHVPLPGKKLGMAEMLRGLEALLAALLRERAASR